LVARLRAAIGTPEFHDCPPLTALPAFSKLALGELTPRNSSLRMVEESREELDEIERLLNILVA
jgi:hypothetical protein